MLMQKGKNPNYIIFYYNGNQFPNSVVKYFRKITEINKGWHIGHAHAILSLRKSDKTKQRN